MIKIFGYTIIRTTEINRLIDVANRSQIHNLNLQSGNRILSNKLDYFVNRVHELETKIKNKKKGKR